MVKETENGQRDRNTDSLADSTRFPFCRHLLVSVLYLKQLTYCTVFYEIS